MPPGSSIVDLRNLLTQRFPHLRFGCAPQKPAETLPTGIAALDQLLGGGLPRAQFTELIAGGHGSGSTEVIHELLRQAALHRQFLVLVDGAGSFDPGAENSAVLTRLLWIRCQKTTEALKATDLLLRDRNFSLLVLDLKLNPAAELRRIPSSTWYRYARLLEQNEATVLVITPQQLVPVAACRVALDSRLGIGALDQPRAELLTCLRFKAAPARAETQLREHLKEAV